MLNVVLLEPLDEVKNKVDFWIYQDEKQLEDIAEQRKDIEFDREFAKKQEMYGLPHKPEPQTSKDRAWHSGEWNQNLCRICERRLTHPIHDQKYRDNFDLYKKEHPNKP